MHHEHPLHSRRSIDARARRGVGEHSARPTQRWTALTFGPEFTQAVAAVRGDVEVGVLEERGEPVGFFPFQRSRRNVARPVGGKMSDFQGLIAPQRRSLGSAAALGRLPALGMAFRSSHRLAAAASALSLERCPVALS